MNYLITGDQGSGKTTKAFEIIGEKEFIESMIDWHQMSENRNIVNICTKKKRDYILIEEVTDDELKEPSFIQFINQLAIQICQESKYMKMPNIIITSEQDINLEKIWFKDFKHIRLSDAIESDKESLCYLRSKELDISTQIFENSLTSYSDALIEIINNDTLSLKVTEERIFYVKELIKQAHLNLIKRKEDIKKMSKDNLIKYKRS